MLSRRDFIRNASSLLLIPAYVKAESLMKVVVPKGPFDGWYSVVHGRASPVFIGFDPAAEGSDFTSISGMMDDGSFYHFIKHYSSQPLSKWQIELINNFQDNAFLSRGTVAPRPRRPALPTRNH